MAIRSKWPSRTLVLKDSGAATVDAFLAQGLNRYVFEFGSGSEDWQFTDGNDCRIYGLSLAAWALCLKNDANNTIQARECASYIKLHDTDPS